MNRGFNPTAVAVAAVSGFVLLSWIASAILLMMMKVDVTHALPHTIYLYAFQYSDNERVQNALFISGIVAVGIGFGIAAAISSLRKETIHGDAKWATVHDLKKGGLLSDTGILLGKHGKKFITLPGELFAMVAAPTRSGKGVGLVIPNLLNWSQSVVVLDIKFENYEITSGFRQRHGQDVFLFNPAPKNYRTHRYNALEYISADANHRIDDIQKIAGFLIPTPKSEAPIWSAEARDLFFGVVLFILEAEDFPRTIGEVLRQLKTEKETAEYFADEIEKHRENLSAPCIAALSNFIHKPPKERSGVKSTLTSALNLWSNPLVDAATSANDFDLRELRKKPMTIYIGITPDNLGRLAPIINLFVQQLIDLNTQELPAKYNKKGKLLSGNPVYKHQVLLLLDEFTAIGRLEILEKAIAFIAGYGLRLMTIIQAPSQLRSVYGHDVAETMQKNYAATTIFRPERMKEAEEIASELGFKTVKQTSITTPRGLGKGSGTKARSDLKRQLLLPQEVRQLPDDKEIILTSGLPPIMAKKIKYFEDPAFTKRLYDKIEIPLITVQEASMHGQRTSVDLSFIYDQVPIPEHDDRELTSSEIEEAAEIFFDSMVEQNNG